MIVAAAAGTFSRATKFPEESFRITGENGSSNTTTTIVASEQVGKAF